MSPAPFKIIRKTLDNINIRPKLCSILIASPVKTNTRKRLLTGISVLKIPAAVQGLYLAAKSFNSQEGSIIFEEPTTKGISDMLERTKQI